MESRGDRQLIEFFIPTRGLIGLRSRALTASQGEAVVSYIFDHYEPFKGAIPSRGKGPMVSMGNGKAIPFAIDGLQQRGEFFIEPGTDTYEGMIVGEHCKEGDLVVNVQRAKQLTNLRAAGSDRNMQIAPARKMSLEQALEYIEDDEKRWKEDSPRHMQELLALLEQQEDWSAEALDALVMPWIEAHEYGVGIVMNAFRICLVGAARGPHIWAITDVLGKAETIKRVKDALTRIGNC